LSLSAPTALVEAGPPEQAERLATMVAAAPIAAP
jgi:hypothetical protein